MHIPEALIKAIQDENLVLWVGSGYSMSLNFPKWDGLIERFARGYYKNDQTALDDFLELLKLEKEKEKWDLLSLLEKLDDPDKRIRFLDKLPSIFNLPEEETEDPAYNKFRLLWELSNKIVTTNYDRSLDITIRNKDTQTILWHDSANYKALIENAPSYLFKVHGTIGQIGDNHQRNCVFFKEQYEKVYLSDSQGGSEIRTEKETAFFLKHILTNHKVLFIGYGGFDSDTNVDYIFKYMESLIGDFSQNKYFYFSVDGKEIDRDYLTPIPLKDYDSLVPYLKELGSYKADSLRQDDMIDDYPSEYVGRRKEVKALNDFFDDRDRHFLFIWGRGGMGKTHLLKTVLNSKGVVYHYYKLGVTTTLQHLANQLKLGIEIREEAGDYSQKFINAIERLNAVIIFDDFYEIDTSENQDPKLKNTLLRLSDSRSNKIIIISRAMESKFERRDNNIQVDFLDEQEHYQFAKNFVDSDSTYKFEDFDATESKIWKISRGYPLVTELLLYILGQKYLYGDFNLDEYESFDFRQFDDDDKYNVGRLVKAVLKGKEKDQEVLNLLFDISISRKEVPADLLKKFASPRIFRLAHDRKGFIRVNEKEDKTYTFSLHPLIWELIRNEAGKREESHLKYAEYYFSKLLENNHDLDAYRLADFHYSQSPAVHYDEYMRKIRTLKERVKSIDIDIRTRITLYEIIIDQGNDNPANYTILARELLKQQELDRAVDILNAGKEKNEENIVILNMLGRIYRYQGQKKLAIKTLHEAFNLQMNPQTANELGIAYRENRDLDNSIDVLRQANSLFSDNMHIANELGRSLMEKGEYEDAKDVLERAHRIDPLNKFVSWELGKAYRELNWYENSIDVLTSGLRQGPRYADGNKRFFVELALTYKANNQLPKAIEILEESVENIKNPENNLEALNQLGKNYTSIGDYDKAIAVLNDSIKYGPGKENIHSYTELGIAYQKNGLLQESINKLREALKIVPENPNIANRLAVSLFRAKEKEEALEIIEKSLSFPKNKNNNYLKDLRDLINNSTSGKGRQQEVEQLINDPKKLGRTSTNKLHSILNHFIFSDPNYTNARFIYEELEKRPDHNRNWLKLASKFIPKLAKIKDLRFQTPEKYNAYVYNSIRFGFKTEAITLLYKLITLFPDNAYLQGKLGRTLCSNEIREHEKGKDHLMITIDLLKKEGDEEAMTDYVFHYLYALLNNGDLNEIDGITEKFSKEIQSQQFRFYMFQTKLLEKRNEAFEVVCQSYLKCINATPDDWNKEKYIDLALKYLKSNQVDLTENKFALSLLKMKEGLKGSTN